MAGKKTEEFSFDDDFMTSFDDDGFGGFQPTTKTSATRKAVTEFSGSFLSGVKKSLLNPSNQRKFLAKNMPDGYLAVFDAASMGARGVKDIYSSAKDELTKNTKDIAKDVNVLNKYYGKHLPKAMQEKLNRKLEQHTGGGYTAPTEEEELGTDLDALMGGMLDMQRTTARLQQATAEETANRIVATQLGNTAAVSATNQILSHISGNSDRGIGIGVTSSKLQRKSIELTYKQFVVQRQMLDTLQQTQEMQREAFKQLIKNTGLPEAVKQTNWELASKSLKQKMIGLATERATANFAPVASHIFDTAKKNVSEKIQMGGGLASMFTSMLAMQAEMGDMMGSKSSRAGEAAGGIAGWAGQKLLRSKLGDRLKKNQKLKTGGDAMMNFMDSFPGMFNKLQQNGGGFSEIMRMLGVNDILVPDSALNTRVRGSGFKHLDEMTSFNRQSQLALTEVIPGWLGKIHHELAIMRTGDLDTEEQRFDMEKGTFTTKSAIRERAAKSMFDKSSMEQSRGQAHRIVNELDSKKELSKKDRALLMRYVIQQANSDTGYIDPQALMTAADSPLNKYDPKAAQRIADVLSNENNFNSVGNGFSDYSDKSILSSNLNGNSVYQSRMRGANDQLKELRRRLPNSMKAATAHASVGNIDILAETGAVTWDPNTKDWKFNNEAFYDAIISGQGPSAGSPTKSGVGRSGPPGGFSPVGARPYPGGSAAADIAAAQPQPKRDVFAETDSGEYTPFQRELLETLERVSSRAAADSGNQILEAIRQRLEMGIPQGAVGDTAQNQNRKSKWFRNLLSGSMQGAGKGIKSYFKFAAVKVPNAAFNAFVRTPLRIMRGVTDLPMRMLRSVAGGGSQLISSTSKKFKKAAGDLYVKGKDSPVIKWKDLQAGEYFDQKTKKVIKSFKDIKGAVVDKAGNVVITEEDIKNGLYAIVQGKAVSVIGGALRAGLGLIGGMMKAPFAGLSGITRTATAVAKFGIKMLRSTPDVYVAGETTPRLLGRIMANGGYFNKDGSPIKSVFDIKGEVVDSSGDVVLAVADMAKGLVDKDGKPFKSLMEKLKSVVFAPVKLLFRGAAKVASVGRKLAMLPFKLLGKGAKGISALLAKDKTATHSDVILGGMSDTLTNIYNLLEERMPRPKGSWLDKDGSGFRDGSREDQLANRNKGAKDGAPAAADDSRKDRKGIMGILMAIAGGIGGLIGTVKGWATNIFTLMRLATQTKLAGSALDAIGALAGGRGGKGGGKGRGKLGALFGGMKALFTKTKLGKVAAGVAIGGGAMLASQTSFAQGMMNSAASAITGSDEQAFKEIAGGGSGGSGSSSSGGSSSKANGEEGPSLSQRVMNGVGGSIMGEMGAIAAFPALAALYNKAKGTKALGKYLPEMKHGAGAGKAPTSKMGKAWQFLSGTNKGRLLLAGLTGAGFVGGNHLLGMGGGGESLAEEASDSFRNTLLLELGMATAAPWAIGKGKQLLDARKAAKMGVPAHAPTPLSPVTAKAPTTGHVFTPVNKHTVAPKATVPTGPAAVAATAPKAAGGGIMSKAAGMGKGLFRNAGLIGTGYAAYDALTTEGSMWDKTKAFGTSLATSAAIGKGLSLAGKLATGAGRQVAMQGLRSAAMYGGTALVSALGAPVVLGALAVGAAGLALWKGYKYFFGTDKNAIARFRLAQYGFKLDDKEKAAAIGKFEQLCQKHVVLEKGGKAKFKKNMPTQEVLACFGIDPKDQETVQRLIKWFEGRFKPVFLNAYAFYFGKTEKTTLEKADTLDKETKLQMLNAMAAVSGSPYDIMESPFPDGKKLKFDAGDVKSELKTAIRNVENEKGPNDKSIKEKAANSIKNAWEAAKGMASKAGDAVVNGGRAVVSAVTATAKAVGGAIGWAAKAGGAVVSGVKNAASTVGNTIGQAYSDTTGGAGFFKGSGGSVGDLPKPNGKGWKAVKATILGAAKMVGVEPSLLIAIAAVESGFNPSAKASTSSAAGLFQFISSTWNAMVNKYGSMFGIPSGTSALDGRANAVLGACYIKENAQVVKKIKGSVSATDVYMAHFLGSGGVKQFLTAMMKTPSASAASVMPKAAAANKPIFYNGGRPRSLSEVYTLMQNKLATKAKQFGVDAEYLSAIGGSASAGDGGGTSALANDTGGAGAAGDSVTGNTSGGGGSSGGWFGYMTGGGGGRPIAASASAGGGFGGGTDLVAAAKSGAVVTSGDAAGFIKSLDPKLIELGRKATKLADKNVDVAGMVKGFMIIFYAMIGEAVQRKVLGSVMVNSANRSIAKQKELYDAYIRDPKRNPMAAKPGSSRHNYGVAIDINSANANALASAGLLSKYGFTRPLLNHPKKPEPWHLESTYFKRGSGTTEKEVAKATKDSGNKAKVEKATKDQAKASPIVKAEQTTKPIPPTIAAPKQEQKTVIPYKAPSNSFAPTSSGSAEDNLKALSSGFMSGGGGASWTPSNGVAVPEVETEAPLERVTNVLGRSQTSPTSTSAAEATHQAQMANTQQASSAMMDIAQQQLGVQQSMLGVLTEIRDLVQQNGAGAAPAEPPKQNSANRAAEIIRGKNRDLPVSMSIKR